MANCENCGVKLNSFNERYPLWADCERRFCSKCQTRFEKMLQANSLRLGSPKITRDFISSHTQSLDFSASGIQYLLDYADYIDAHRGPTPEEIALEEERKKETKSLPFRIKR